MESNPDYRRHFEKELSHLGSDHILIKTQYLLESVSAIGNMFSPAQIINMSGDFNRLHSPHNDFHYFIGIDIGGQAAKNEKHDESVLVVAAKPKNQSDQNAYIVNCYRWKGADWDILNSEMLTIINHWRPSRVVIDGRGIGNPCAMRIAQNYRHGSVEIYQASSASVSDDGFYLLSLAGFGNLKIFNSNPQQGSNFVSSDDIFQQLRYSRRELIGNGQMRFYVPEKYGHDDILKAIAYALRASKSYKIPIRTF